MSVKKEDVIKSSENFVSFVTFKRSLHFAVLASLAKPHPRAHSGSETNGLARLGTCNHFVLHM